MQGQKEFSPKMLYTVNIDQLVSRDNFYRLLNRTLNLHWLYRATEKYYGSEGQESIDPVVFFKICLVGYLNGIHSDRKLIDYCSDSLSIRLFLGYDIDENLPWHSTISRTRHLYGEEEFKILFEKVFALCAQSGMVLGHTQAIDGAFLKANASKDSLEVKQVNESIDEYMLENIKANGEARRAAKNNKAEEDQRKMDGDQDDQERDLNELAARYERQNEQYKNQPASDCGKFLSNKTHYSPTDPDARIAVKPGKTRDLYFSGQIAVDTCKHVITHAQTFLADNRDGAYLTEMVQKTNIRLNQFGLKMDNCLADGAYSSGENYKYLEQNKITPYIPLLGGAKGGSENFMYDEIRDVYICPNNKILKGSGRVVDDGKGNAVKKYFSKRSDCKKCPIRNTCISDKAKAKRVQHSIYKPQFEKAVERQHSIKGRIMKRKRSSTVEPVWGKLINFLGLRRMTSRGIKCANQSLLMAATCYNLKKYLRHIQRSGITNANAVKQNIGDFFICFLADPKLI